jgi:raffinose/stachyose/melibiose transport system substrate-binding protein
MTRRRAHADRFQPIRPVRALALLAALLLALGAAACGGSDDDGGGNGGAKGGGEKTTVKFLTGRSEVAANEKESKRLIEVFEKQNPNITVKREAMDSDQLRTVMNTRLGSNNAPDLITYDTGPGFGGVLARSNLIQPIEDAYSKFGWDIFDWAKQRATYGGKTYGVPDQVEEVGIYYNKDLFEKLGFNDEPKTLDEFMAIAEKAKQNDLIPLAFGDQEQWPAGHQFSMLVSNLLGREGLDEILYGDGKWNSPKVVKAIDIFFRQFNDKGYFPKGVNGLGYDDANQLFYSGKAVMVPTGTWLVSEISQTVKFDVGFFPFPAIDGSKIAAPAGVGSGWFIPAKAKNREGALKLLNFFVQSDAALKSGLTVFNAIPAHPVETEGLEIPPLFKEVLTDLEKTDESAFGYNIDVLTPQNFNEVMFTGFQSVLSGQRSPQEQADKLQQAWEKAKAKGDILEKP